MVRAATAASAVALCLALCALSSAHKVPFYLEDGFVPDIDTVSGRQPTMAEPAARFSLSTVQRLGDELSGVVMPQNSPAELLEMSAQTGGRRVPRVEIDPFGNELQDNRQPLPRVRTSRPGDAFSAPSFAEVMGDMRETLRNPHPDPHHADHHQPVFNQQVVARPSVRPPPMSAGPDLPASWDMTPAVASRLRARSGAPKFTTTALLSESEVQRRRMATVKRTKRASLGPHMPRLAPPPSAHPLARNKRRLKLVTKRRSRPVHNDGQVPSFVQIKNKAKVQSKSRAGVSRVAKPKTDERPRLNVRAKSDTKRVAALPDMPVVGRLRARAERRYD